MFSCKPLSFLPIQSDRDFAVAEVGDTVLIPESRFERLFGEFMGGILGIQLEFLSGQGVACTLYATAAPHTEPDATVYLPNWLIWTLEQKMLRFDELQCRVKKAPELGRAAVIVARPCIDMGEADIRGELEAALYDNRYVHTHTIMHIASGDIWIESVTDEDGFEMEAGLLGPEISLEILGVPGLAEAEAEAAKAEAEAAAAAAEAEAEAAKPIIPALDTIRALRLKYYNKEKSD